MSFTWFVGARYLQARQKQAFISLITLLATAGIAVGVPAWLDNGVSVSALPLSEVLTAIPQSITNTSP